LDDFSIERWNVDVIKLLGRLDAAHIQVWYHAQDMHDTIISSDVEELQPVEHSTASLSVCIMEFFFSSCQFTPAQTISRKEEEEFCLLDTLPLGALG
jgi:hypothetical protein